MATRLFPRSTLSNVVSFAFAVTVAIPVIEPLVNEEFSSVTSTVLANSQFVKSTLLPAIVRALVNLDTCTGLLVLSVFVQVTVRSSVFSLIEERA